MDIGTVRRELGEVCSKNRPYMTRTLLTHSLVQVCILLSLFPILITTIIIIIIIIIILIIIIIFYFYNQTNDTDNTSLTAPEVLRPADVKLIIIFWQDVPILFLSVN